MFKMTPNILRNLVGKKSTRRYPAEQREPFEKVRGELENDIGRCIFCGTCAAKCPSQCIEVDKKACQWVYNTFACVFCGVCVDNCPTKSLSQKRRPPEPVFQHFVIRLQGKPKEK